MARIAKLLSLAVLLAGGATAMAADRVPAGTPKLPFQVVPANSAQPPATAVATAAAQSGVEAVRRPPSPRHAAGTRSTVDQPLPLAPPRRAGSSAAERPHSNTPARALSTVISSVAVVLGLFALLVWIARRTRPRQPVALPGEVLETLGRAPLNNRQEMQLVRVGNKLLLLSVTATAAETLTEITDPEEIERLAGICRGQSDGLSVSLREMLAHLGTR